MKQATRLLASSQWDLETAIGHFYDTGMVADRFVAGCTQSLHHWETYTHSLPSPASCALTCHRVAVDTSKLGALFDKYAGTGSCV